MQRAIRVPAAIVLACSTAAIQAQRQLVEVSPPSGVPLVRQLTAAPRDFVELCTRLQAGAAFDWAFQADAPVVFNTHFHENGAVKYPEGLSAVTAAEGRLAPSTSQIFCWQWSNLGTESVTIRMHIVP